MEKTSEEYRAEFLRIFEKYVHRKGTEEMLAWLDTTDFFTCPASSSLSLLACDVVFAVLAGCATFSYIY